MEFAKMFVQTMLTMITSAFGLVVALAWNEAIKAWMEEGLAKGDEPTTGSLFTYAIVATVVGVLFVLLIGWVASKIGGKAAIEREADL
jgi:ABC-type branched-subunit amino acid transport system permease subunit